MANDVLATIGKIIEELDVDQSNYQVLYKKYYGKADEQAKSIHSRLVAICERIKKSCAGKDVDV